MADQKEQFSVEELLGKTKPKTPKPKKKDEEENSSNFLELLGQASTLGWNLVVPIVGGVLLGYYLDNRIGDGLTWTLSLLVLGVMIAFSNLYNLYSEHSKSDTQGNDQKEKQEEKDVQEE